VQAITKNELRELAEHGEGVVLVDRHGRSEERQGTLHDVSCPWPWKASLHTPLLYEISYRAALNWLTNYRGPEGTGWKRCNDCRASAMAPPGRADKPPEAEGPAGGTLGRAHGQPVWTTDRGRDIGWVTNASPPKVAAFDSPGEESFDERAIEAYHTSAFLPRAGDRCYVEQSGSWVPARCKDSVLDGDQMISVICDGQDRKVSLTALRFRRLAPLAAPIAELASHRAGVKSRFLARSSFSDSYWRSAQPSRGLLGVSSAAVDLYPHQVGVARRILADPVQRYLLADEVGLGKTIEAGLVIRQRLIDAPRSVVRLLVPDALVWQWESELEAKFAISQLGGVELFAFSDSHAFEPALTPDLVVIDEAHRVAAGWNSPAKELAERFTMARALAHRVPRILLLSATPVLHREADLLAMLHLLDPDTYRLEDIDAFRARIAGRERIGELLLSLRPAAPAFLLRARLPELRETFPNDLRMAQLVDNIALRLDGDAPERETALADARAHISETYRLHRRLLRNRRSSVQGTSYMVRGRQGVTVLLDGDRRRPAVDSWLERWRLTLLEEAYESDDPDAVTKAVAAFLIYAAASSGDLSLLGDLLQFKLTWKRAYRDAAGLAPDEAAAVRSFPISARQREVLSELVELLDESDSETGARASNLANAIVGLNAGSVVVFVPSERIAEALQARLTAAGQEALTYTAGRSDFERRMSATDFADGEGSRFLICDRTGEEGLNLQVADCIVHVDLPLSTARIEQRIGRVDRHGQPEPVTNYVVDPGPEHGYCAWWLKALTGAFGVFDQTTAPVQYSVETVEGELLTTLVLEGLDEAFMALGSVKARVDEEQERIERLDSLDALAREESDDVAFVERLLAMEADSSDDFSTAALRALDSASRDLGARVIRKNGRDSIYVSAERPALRVYPDIADRDLLTAASRSVAVEHPNVTLLLPGAPIVEALRLHLAWDERCQTAAVWAVEETRSEPMLAVRCDVIVRADPSPAFIVWKGLEATRPRTARASRTDADAPLAIAALQRRLDAYFSPRPATVWIDRYGRAIDDPELLASLSRCIGTGADQHWSDEQWTAVARSCGASSLDDVLMPLTPLVNSLVLADISVRADARLALERARSDWDEAERALRLRAELNLDTSVASRDLSDERDMARHLTLALESPTVEWAGAALVFLTNGGECA
jgi:ATP-dependent helicase HepA